MVEVLNSNESALDKEVKEAVSGFKEEEKILEEDVINDQDTEKIKKVEKLPNGKVIFPYTYGEYECTLILERKGNKIMVNFPEKNKIKLIPTYMGNSMVYEFKKGERKELLSGKEIDASSSEKFLIELQGVLNIIVGQGRISAPEKGKQAYDFLFPKEK